VHIKTFKRYIKKESNPCPRHKSVGRVEVYIHLFLTLALNGGFTPAEIAWYQVNMSDSHTVIGYEPSVPSCDVYREAPRYLACLKYEYVAVA
jgi:hypothetical protein